MAHLGLTQRDLVTLLLLTKDVVTNITIESEALNWEAVRSCIARKLGGANSALNNVYCLSTQIQRECKQMYEQLEATQRSTMDVNSWLDRFLPCLLRA